MLVTVTARVKATVPRLLPRLQLHLSTLSSIRTSTAFIMSRQQTLGKPSARLRGVRCSPVLSAGKFFGKGGDPPVQAKLEDAFRGKRKRSTKAEKDEKDEGSDANFAKAEKGAISP